MERDESSVCLYKCQYGLRIEVKHRSLQILIIQLLRLISERVLNNREISILKNGKIRIFAFKLHKLLNNERNY